MILVSLSSYCQYPIVKTIGKDTVVIMTIKQAQEINQKFLDLRDSINSLDKTITVKRVEIDSLKTEKQKVQVDLNTTSEKLTATDKQMEVVTMLAQEEDKRHWRQKRMWALYMGLSFAVTVIVGALK
jgi:hypothetical protein